MYTWWEMYKYFYWVLRRLFTNVKSTLLREILHLLNCSIFCKQKINKKFILIFFEWMLKSDFIELVVDCKNGSLIKKWRKMWSIFVGRNKTLAIKIFGRDERNRQRKKFFAQTVFLRNIWQVRLLQDRSTPGQFHQHVFPQILWTQLPEV